MRVQSETCDGRPLPAYKVAQVPNCQPRGGGGLRHFFPDLKFFASTLQAHSRGTLRTSHISDKQKQFYFLFLFFFGREILAYQCESVRLGWNAWVSRSMRESWQPTILGLESMGNACYGKIKCFQLVKILEQRVLIAQNFCQFILSWYKFFPHFLVNKNIKHWALNYFFTNFIKYRKSTIIRHFEQCNQQLSNLICQNCDGSIKILLDVGN